MNERAGHLGQRIEDMGLHPPDWSRHEFGYPDSWPSDLKTLVYSMLSSPVPSYICWGPKRVFLFNKAYQPLLDTKASRAFGRDFADVWPEVWPELSPLFDAVGKGEVFLFRDHLLHLHRKGYEEAAYFDFSFAPVYTGDGAIIGLQCHCAETTERKTAEFARLQAEEQNAEITLSIEAERTRFINFLNDAPIAAAILDGPDHVFTYVNDVYANLVANRDLLGRSVHEAFPELRSQGFYELLDEVYATGLTFRSSEIDAMLHDRDGRSFGIVIELIYAARKNRLGNIEGVSVFAIDVSSKVEARKRVESQESFIRLVTDSIPAHIAYVDTNLRMKFANAHIRKTFGKSDEELIDQPISVLLTPEQLEERRVGYAEALQGKHQQILVTSTGMDGKVHITNNVLTPDFGPDGKVNGIVIIAYDRTDEEQLKSDLVQAKNEADAANSAKSAFLANMSHEIRSPLGAMMGFVSLLKDGHLTPEESQHYLEIINRNSQQVVSIIDDILDLSKVEAGKILLENLTFSLHDLLIEFGSIMAFRAKENGIDFLVEAETEIPESITSDPTRIRQILANIVGNAIKFTRSGSVRLLVRLDGNNLSFKVVDTGIGISSEDTKKLFQPFQQADASITRKFGGTGLGLILTRRLCEVMGGTFRLESSVPGKGSTFIARIAIAHPAESRSVDFNGIQYIAPKPPVTADKPFIGRRMLVVDDTPDNQLLIRVMLKRSGAEIEIASNGLEGMQKALNSKFDLVIMDVQMPVMGGNEAVAKLRSLGYEQPIVALTAHAMLDERQRCLEAGYSDFLSKPIDLGELQRVLKRLLSTNSPS